MPHVRPDEPYRFCSGKPVSRKPFDCEYYRSWLDRRWFVCESDWHWHQQFEGGYRRVCVSGGEYVVTEVLPRGCRGVCGDFSRHEGGRGRGRTEHVRQRPEDPRQDIFLLGEGRRVQH